MRKFENQLTKDIISNKLNLEQVILHNDLSVSLRNESKELLDFLFQPDNYDDLINYALFDKSPETEEYKYLTKKQINNNAANILSYPSRKIKQIILKSVNGKKKPLLLQKMEIFLKKKNYCLDPFYAGHFERIYESILREQESGFDTFFNENFVSKLIPHVIENILIFPYRELFQALLEDFIDEMGEERTDYILEIILQQATFYSFILFKNSKNKTNSLGYLYNKSKKKFKDHRPINKYGKKIPLPQFVNYRVKNGDVIEKTYIDNAKKLGKDFFPEDKNPDKFQDENIDDIAMRAYFFLSCIYRAFDNNKCFDPIKKPKFLEMLLYCGVFNDTESLSSMEAFRILESVYYGNTDENYFIPPYQDQRFLDLIDKYADFVSYNHKSLNLLEVNAFPLFWNHRYQYKQNYNKSCLIGIDPILGINSSIECDVKQTPLLVLRPLLFADPPISSKLIFSYLKIFRFLDFQRIQLTGEESKPINQYDKETQEKIRKIDFIVYEFIQRPFPFYIAEETQKYNFFTFYEALDEIIPIFPKDEKSSVNSQIRAALNGSAFELCRTFQNSSFFILNNEPSDLLIDIDKNFHINNKDFNSVIEVLQYHTRNISIGKNTDIKKEKLNNSRRPKLHEFKDEDEEEDNE